MLSCHDVARYFLSLMDEDAGDLMSNLKLQNLVYYAQGFHLAIFDTPLFNEPVKALPQGPVVLELFQAYEKHGKGPIPPPADIDFGLYPQGARKLLDEVYALFGQFSAWKLRNMTHTEPPWMDAAPDAGEITHDAMKEYFATQVENR